MLNKNKFQEIKIKYKNQEIRVDAKICLNNFEKILGKMFSLNKQPLLFVFPEEQKISIHMLFVFTPLLVVWLDKNKKVVKIKKMKPFISFDSAKAKYVLEIPV